MLKLKDELTTFPTHHFDIAKKYYFAFGEVSCPSSSMNKPMMVVSSRIVDLLKIVRTMFYVACT
jgi:hypothetical protein